ncbi:GNAT family N-acetyltransferase [Macrococcus sp. EM39E]|uniref:GNAT family N-acetyltransferase n=1 Tax=Macrococcus animalis TaxID=3395467 RepID=UPI0039BE1E6B
MIYFETERLKFRDWQESDLVHFQAMNKDFDVRRYFPDVMSSARSEIAFYLMQQEIVQHELGLFAVELKSTRKFIGFIGMQYLIPTKHFDLSFMPCYEIGWRLKRMYWNQGYATEGAHAVLNYAKEKGIKEVYSYTSLMNRPSRRIMDKLGMTYVKSFNHPFIRDYHPLREQVLFYKDLTIEEHNYDINQ